VAGRPTVYAIFRKLPIEGHVHEQLTYTAWYPAHPRSKAIDLEAADIDSCVLRLTLDPDNAPVLYETIAACGCFHKLFVPRWLEEKARATFGPPERKLVYSVEKDVPDAINWEVAGLVDEPHDRPRHPVVFLKAGEHKLIGLGSAARLRVPADAEKHPYVMTSYADLYEVPVDGRAEKTAFFDMENGGKVRGAERRGERFLFRFAGVDAAGQPRATIRSACTSTRAPGATPPSTASTCASPRGLCDRRTILTEGTTMHSDPPLRVQGLTKDHGTGAGRVRALRGIDLEVAAGEFVALTGASGSGKSTLLHLVAGLDLPTAGGSWIRGTDLASLSDDERTLLRRRQVGMIFQAFHLLDAFAAEENVAVPLVVAGRPRAEARRRAAALLDRVGLSARRKHLPQELSGGEQQRVAIARALAAEPMLLLADEPT
jgi:putative ABC transport system ATP-binding protein